MLLCVICLPGAGHAQGADGVWGCSATGQLPIGIVTIAGTSYDFTATDTGWNPVQDGSNGSGTLTLDDRYLIPVDGPLLTEFGVTGATDVADSLTWSNGGGALLFCRRLQG